ncbi:MAG TPA: response regulator transcription factor [Candidatus Dojkabacteria bacterium]|nr:response regulator transcription factor [Candidatus Dojkabacteria bacterium]HQF36584.1 response regulator transcription factor [Candidatus Dojkabacteria bacterium]
MKILIVEDETDLREILVKYLSKHGYVVEEAEDGAQGLELALINEYDCLLLDLNLPEIDGMEVAKRIRDDGNLVPIIMLTARSQMYDKLDGFEIGADDYITKPFELKELLARIKAVIKRSSKNKNNKLFFGDFEIFAEKNLLVSSDNSEIELSNKEMGILEYLLRNKGKAISAEELLEHVWDREIDIFTSTVKTHIKTLRKKVDPNKRYIKTLKGKGYLISDR